MTATVLASLTAQASARGWTDRQWAAAAGVRHETLSRVKRRGQCDTATLEALARACACSLRLEEGGPRLAVDASGLWPQRLDRANEERLLTLAASGNRDLTTWRAAGPSFLLAGLAFLLATQDDFERVGYTALAEELHPGIGSHDAFRRWLRETPLKPYRVLPMVRRLRRSGAPARDLAHG
jgi:hypothetical protein